MDENVDPAKFRRLLDFPSFGVWGAVGVGWLEPGLGVGPAGLLVHLGKYLDLAGDRDRYGPEPSIWGTKISRNRLRGLSANGVTIE